MVFDETEIRRAFEKDEFFPVFQPLVELRTGQLAGFEVLARWIHGKLGAIGPDEFIPLLERTGFIDQLTGTILEKAFACPLLANDALTLAVNISPIQLLGQNLPQRIAAAAERGCFSLDRLTIEITESALVDDLARAKAAAAEFKALHCKLALDDFGTGYSSLKHLHALPFDALKVDRSFVSSMAQQRDSRKIVASVIGLGQSLGLSTVAEGVETQEQANMLLWLGCDLGQGWLHGKPVGARELQGVVNAIRRKDSITVPVPLDEGSIVSFETLPAHRLAQLQAIYDGAPVGLCFLDRKMRYVSINKRLSQMNGVPVSEHLGKSVGEVVPQVLPLVESYIRRALHGQPVTGVEVQRPAADGDKTILLSYQPARDEAGEVIGVSVAMMDITETKRAEAALRESEDHYRNMVKLSPHVPWVLNAKGEVTEASPRWEAFTGQTIAKALGSGWLEVLHPDDVEPTLAAIRKSLETGQSIDIEYRVQRPCGGWTLMRSRGSPRFGPTGKIFCIYGVVEEGNGQKQASPESLACQAKLQATLDAVPIAILVADAQDCSIVSVNPEAKRIFRDAVFPGQTVAEYTRLGVARPNGEPLRPEEYPIVRTMVRGEAVDSKRLVYTRADGTRFDLSVSSKPIFAQEGKLIGAVLMLRDMGMEN